MARFAGKAVVVVGAGSVAEGWGNGKAAAVAYAREGGRVLCVDRAATAAAATCALIAAEGHSAVPFVSDLTTPGAAEAMVEAAEAAFGRIDVLHFNIGISTPGGVGALDWDEWDRVFNTNVKAAARAAQAVLPPMLRQGKGAMVFISSLASVHDSPYAYTSYEASKAALNRMSRSIAVQYAAAGIRCNTVLPGVIDTPHAAAYVTGTVDHADTARRRAAMVPMQRQGTAWEVAEAALFLASDAASFITGVALPVDGGMCG
ncbi:MAG: SDR family oxidoreductase [Rhodobacteraceae bacterium]|nr:SDR family oxidoreductase [Paracoccaceae bacterium]